MLNKDNFIRNGEQPKERKVVIIDGKSYLISPVHPDLLAAAAESNRRFFEELDKRQDELLRSRFQ